MLGSKGLAFHFGIDALPTLPAPTAGRRSRAPRVARIEKLCIPCTTAIGGGGFWYS